MNGYFVWNVDNTYTVVLLVNDYPLNSHACMGFKHDQTHGFITECITGLEEIILSHFQVLNYLEEITML